MLRELEIDLSRSSLEPGHGGHDQDMSRYVKICQDMSRYVKIWSRHSDLVDHNLPSCSTVVFSSFAGWICFYWFPMNEVHHYTRHRLPIYTSLRTRLHKRINARDAWPYDLGNLRKSLPCHATTSPSTPGYSASKKLTRSFCSLIQLICVEKSMVVSLLFYVLHFKLHPHRHTPKFSKKPHQQSHAQAQATTQATRQAIEKDIKSFKLLSFAKL